jgi:hypothetical protein
MGWLISAASSAVTGHLSSRSSSCPSGSNSVWGQLTGGGSDRDDNTGTTVNTPINKGFILSLLSLGVFTVVPVLSSLSLPPPVNCPHTEFEPVHQLLLLLLKWPVTAELAALINQPII